MQPDPLDIHDPRAPLLPGMGGNARHALTPSTSRSACPWPLRRARDAVHARLAHLSRGRLELIEPGHTRAFGQPANEAELCVRVQVLDPRLWSAMALAGSVGAGEACMAGYWRCDDDRALVDLVRLLLRHRTVLDGMERGIARLTAPLRALRHWLRRNNRAGSRHNVAAHYDLGNDFYRLWLDETLMYSCAWFRDPDMTLAAASTAKLERVCRALDLGAHDHLLEIGTGWGGLALHAASRHGCRVTTITLSPAQFELARQRVAQAGLSERVTVLLGDYRDLAGQYDKLVSIEMVEAVGADRLDGYFRQCGRLLKANGAMLLQAITITDQRYAAALNAVDFIQKHIFPGGFLPSVGALVGAAGRASDLKLVDLVDIGPHYAETLARWRANFLAARERILALGYDHRFLRMWEFYLCYCEGGFRERDLGTVQMLLAKPAWRGHLPLARR
jgi:cyclopropane-fatty-acyl-phospholipid synthase